MLKVSNCKRCNNCGLCALFPNVLKIGLYSGPNKFHDPDLQEPAMNCQTRSKSAGTGKSWRFHGLNLLKKCFWRRKKHCKVILFLLQNCHVTVLCHVEAKFKWSWDRENMYLLLFICCFLATNNHVPDHKVRPKWKQDNECSRCD